MAEKIKCYKCGGDFSDDKGYYNSKSILYLHMKKLPICKDCVDSIYQIFLQKYNDEKIALYELCRKIDMPFHQAIFEGSLKKGSEQVAKHYFRILNSFRDRNGYADDFDSGEKISDDLVVVNYENGETDLDTQMFWGFGFESRDYMFLETEIEKWKQTHKCDNQAELTLLKEICIKILEIRKTREEKQNASKAQKELQDLMKTASVDPAKANVASAGKSHDTWGLWVKDIEQFRPAEWHDQQEKYKDMDGFIPYINNYIVRPIKNFITGNRDFQIIDNINVDLEDVEDGDS